MARNIKELSEQIAAFQKQISEDVEAVKSDTTQIAQEIGIVRKIAEEAKRKADTNEEKIKELEKNLARQSDRQRRRNMIITGIREEILPRQLESELCQWFKENGAQDFIVEEIFRNGFAAWLGIHRAARTWLWISGKDVEK
ncbi:UNVERIFIED_CONTAM: hypothetical protein K2H54_067313 [Gekko kuhli]